MVETPLVIDPTMPKSNAADMSFGLIIAYSLAVEQMVGGADRRHAVPLIMGTILGFATLGDRAYIPLHAHSGFGDFGDRDGLGGGTGAGADL